MANDCIPYSEDADELTGHCTAAVTGKTFVKISAAAQVARAGLSTTADGGNIKIATASANGVALGVAMQDCASGSKVAVHTCGSGKVVPVTADGAITYNDRIVVGASGKAKTYAGETLDGNAGTLTPGFIVGIALDSATDGNDVPVKLI